MNLCGFHLRMALRSHLRPLSPSWPFSLEIKQCMRLLGLTESYQDCLSRTLPHCVLTYRFLKGIFRTLGVMEDNLENKSLKSCFINTFHGSR